MNLFRKILLAFVFPICVLVLHILLFFAGFYDYYPLLDVPMHFLGGFSVAFTYLLLYDFIGLKLKNKIVFIILLIFLTAIAWEVFEFSLDNIFGFHTQNGRRDTLWDVIFGLVGGACSLLTFRNYPKALR